MTIRAEYPNEIGMLAKITSAIGKAGGDIGAIDIVSSSREIIIRDITVNAKDIQHGQEIVRRVRKVPGVRIINVSDPTFLLHLRGKIEMRSKVPVKTRNDLSMAYTPGVARVCMAIHDDPKAVWTLTSKANTVAVVSDGTAVLGLGDIGPEAAMPVMEGKALLFKELAGVDAWPICLRTKEPDKIVEIVKALSTGFGGINLEDISAPRCFYIEEKLKQEADIPIFHDDQHGTAVVVLAGIINALKVVKKRLSDLKIIIVGAGAAGVATTKILLSAGARNVILFDRQGPLSRKRDYGGNGYKKWVAENTNPDDFSGTLSQAMEGADLFIGVSGPGVLKREDVLRMNRDAMVFALANPDPEIMPEEIEGDVAIIATGRSDYPNQINNALCFPGMFRGVLDARAREINDQMKLAAAEAIASVIPSSSVSAEYIVPSVFDPHVVRAVSKAVSEAAHKTGVAQRAPRRVGSYSLAGVH